MTAARIAADDDNDRDGCVYDVCKCVVRRGTWKAVRVCYVCVCCADRNEVGAVCVL